jgi:hypothetical protein
MAGSVPTYRDLRRWLRPLSKEQVAAPILATGYRNALKFNLLKLT